MSVYTSESHLRGERPFLVPFKLEPRLGPPPTVDGRRTYRRNANNSSYFLVTMVDLAFQNVVSARVYLAMALR